MYDLKTKNRQIARFAKEYPNDVLGGNDFHTEPEKGLQPAFQPGNTAVKVNRRYLGNHYFDPAFNMVGTICSIEASNGVTIDVSFHDASQRPFHFTDHHQYNMASLGLIGAVFASESTPALPSAIHYRPIDTWASKNEWTVELPVGESVTGFFRPNSRCRNQ